MGSIILGGKEFKSLNSAKIFAKELLSTCIVGDTLTEDQTAFMVDALKLRGNKGQEKIGVGVDKIKVELSALGSKCFVLYRKDSTKTDFSYIKCFSGYSGRGKKTEKLIDFEAACRTAILKDKPFKPADCHAHHTEIPFKVLVESFIDTYCIAINSVEIVGYGDMETMKSFKNAGMSEMFRRYHESRASFEVLSVEEHKARHLHRA